MPRVHPYLGQTTAVEQIGLLRTRARVGWRRLYFGGTTAEIWFRRACHGGARHAFLDITREWRKHAFLFNSLSLSSSL